MESTTQINSNLLCLIENHTAISSTIGSYLHSPLMQTRYQSQQIKVCKPSKIAGAVKVPTAYKVRSGRLRPAKYISFYEYNLPLPSTLLKSPPTSSAFFTVYNTTKSKLEYHAYCENVHSYVTDVLAVYLGHTASCIVRVPVDLVKQQSRLPVNAKLSVFELINQLVCSNRISEKVAYQLFTTVAREIPFCSIKFPLWEFLKVNVERRQSREIKTYESAICGCLAGGTAAAITTPIDIAYKEVYVNKKGGQYARLRMMYVIRDMAREDGVKGLFAGVKTRVPMVSFGAFLFFGCYEQKKRVLFEEH